MNEWMNKLNSETSCSNNFQVPLIYPVMIWICKQTQIISTSFPSNSREVPRTFFPSNSRREVPLTFFPSHSLRQVPLTFFPSHSRRQVPRTSFPSHSCRQVPRTYKLTPHPFSCRAPRALAGTVFKVWSACDKSECILPCLANCQQFGLFNFCLPESFRFFSFFFPHHLWTTRHVTGTVDPSCTCVLMSCVLPWCDLRSGLGVIWYQHLIHHGSRSGELKTQKIKVPCGENTQLDRSPFEA